MGLSFQKVVRGMRYLKHYGVKEFAVRLSEKLEAEDIPYESWYEKHKATREQLADQRKMAQQWKEAPWISIVVPLYHTPEVFLREMIASVQAQSYENWQLCLADGSADDCAERIVGPFAEADTRIVYSHLAGNLGIAGNTNAAIALAKGDWIAFLDHDDLLAPDALYEAVYLMQKAGRADIYDMIYTDEDKVGMDGTGHFAPHFKPDFNLDLLRSNNYITHFLLVRKEIMEQVGAIQKDYDGAQDYDFILRCVEKSKHIGHIPRILYHWRCHKDSTSENPFSKQYAVDAGRRAIEAHIERMGQKASVTATKDMGFYAVRYAMCGEPLVSVIIAHKGEDRLLKKCIASVKASGYKNFEIIVSRQKNGEQEAALYQAGVRTAKGSYLLFLHSDVELTGCGFLEEMLTNCQRAEIGIVGAKLYYADHTVAHAGIVFGHDTDMKNVCRHVFRGLKGERSGYLHKASIKLDYSAVTAAAMMVKRELYERAGGFLEQFTSALYEVDFCLKVRQLGYLVLFDPDAAARHWENRKSGDDLQEQSPELLCDTEYLYTNWNDRIKNGDPYYNPNLSLTKDYSIRELK